VRRALLLSIAGVLLFAGDARACSCIAPDVDHAQAAFVGRVAEVTDHRVVFDVEASVKGGYAGRAEFGYSVGDGANCGANLRAGERTGVLIYGDEEFVGMCNLMDPAALGLPALSPASLLGTLLGTCWAAFSS
jgi:hypothetical protein